MKKFCDYGCGKEAKYKFKNGKVCCSKSVNQCPSKKERSAKSGIGKKHSLAKPVKTRELCSFGCNQIAKFKYSNGKYCCSDDWHRCPNKRNEIKKRVKDLWSNLELRKKLSKNQRKDLIAVAIPVTDKTRKCFYCGNEAKFWFKTNNRYCCCDRIERCVAVRKSISDRTKALWKNLDYRKKNLANQNYNDPVRKKKHTRSYKKWLSKNYDEFLASVTYANKRRTISKKTREKLRQRLKGKTYEELYGEERAKVIKEKLRKKYKKPIFELSITSRKIMSEKKKKQWKDPNSLYNSKKFRRKKSEEGKRNWKNDKYVQKIQKSLHNAPNKAELFLINLLKQLNLEYKYVGDWSLNLNGKNPDFINKKNNKIIEYFGCYYHDIIVEESREEHEQERINFFKELGYETLVIWEDELNNINSLKEKLLNFDKKSL